MPSCRDKASERDHKGDGYRFHGKDSEKGNRFLFHFIVSLMENRGRLSHLIEKKGVLVHTIRYAT